MKRALTLVMIAATLLITSSIQSHQVIFTGKWDINAETHSMELMLIQTGTQVIGTWDVPLGSGEMGYLTGQVSGHRIEFTYYEVMYNSNEKLATGSGYVELSGDHKSISGKVTSIQNGETYSATWTGTKLE